MMNEAILWVLQIMLAVVFTSAGLMKITTPKSKLVKDKNFKWAKKYPADQLKQIGLLEVILTPLAAIGLALIMIKAAQVHSKRKESAMVTMNMILLVMAVLVAAGRLF